MVLPREASGTGAGSALYAQDAVGTEGWTRQHGYFCGSQQYILEFEQHAAIEMSLLLPLTQMHCKATGFTAVAELHALQPLSAFTAGRGGEIHIPRPLFVKAAGI
jgi:hypothetical protein